MAAAHEHSFVNMDTIRMDSFPMLWGKKEVKSRVEAMVMDIFFFHSVVVQRSVKHRKVPGASANALPNLSERAVSNNLAGKTSKNSGMTSRQATGAEKKTQNSSLTGGNLEQVQAQRGTLLLMGSWVKREENECRTDKG